MKDTIRQIISRPFLQSTWMALLRLSHAGMNCGGGQTVSRSGEILALEHAMTCQPSALPFILFDVGAHEGEYLNEVLSMGRNNVHIYSFEPETKSFRSLCERFKDHNRTNLFHCALGNNVGTCQLNVRDDSSQSSLYGGNVNEFSASQECLMTTLDSFITENCIRRVDFLKIDTEGHELQVILGGQEAIGKGLIHAIQIEFGETYLVTPYHLLDLFNVLASAYDIYRILRNGLYLIASYTHDLEIYKTTNYLCILRNRS